MDPAETDNIKRALANQGALVTKHETTLRQVVDNLQQLATGITDLGGRMDAITGQLTALAHAPPPPPAPVPPPAVAPMVAPREPFIPTPARPGPKLKAYMDQHVSDDSTVNRVMRAKTMLLDELCQSLQTRFSDMSTSHLQAIRLVNLNSWSDAEHSEEFGESEVEVLTRHFQDVLTSSGVAVNQIPDHWTMLKTSLYETGETWPEINRFLKHQCPDILSLVDLVLALPASTADCERGFNQMKLVKSDWRSRLTTSSLCDLMVVQLLSPSIEDFDQNPAVQLWHQASIRARRPNFMEGKRKPQECSASDTSEMDSDEE
ncbi:zinc finger protein 862-like isoform X2 [Scomber scombrus]|uniref:Zinc finger protein 862-like isoform X2 n=1 Tax=Scomber scombrus TaxID=13677 RepID=A0AAV1Q1H5_SCOSC